MIPREAVLGVIAFLALALFGASAAAAHMTVFENLDRSVIVAARTLSTPLLDRVMVAITTLGWLPLCVVLVVAAVIWCLARGDRIAALALAAVGLAVMGATELLKHGFERARPDVYRHDLVTFAFPSGHAMTGVAVYGMLFAVLARRLATTRARVAAWLLGVAAAFLIGISRVYLAVHWPTDVLGGWALGLVLLCLGGAALVRWPQRS
jgi:undecaprenyl-diphosphatase